jgi:uncharacterized protein YfaP (DUF2135 family)
MSNTICLKVMGHHDEGILDTVASPGMAIQLSADGDYDQVVVTTAEAIKKRLRIVKEAGNPGGTVDDAYAIGDTVPFVVPLPGDHVQVLVKSGQNIAVADVGVVEGGGSGLFIEAAGSESRYQVEFLESSGGALAANTLLRAVVL